MARGMQVGGRVLTHHGAAHSPHGRTSAARPSMSSPHGCGSSPGRVVSPPTPHLHEGGWEGRPDPSRAVKQPAVPAAAACRQRAV